MTTTPESNETPLDDSTQLSRLHTHKKGQHSSSNVQSADDTLLSTKPLLTPDDTVLSTQRSEPTHSKHATQPESPSPQFDVPIPQRPVTRSVTHREAHSEARPVADSNLFATASTPAQSHTVKERLSPQPTFKVEQAAPSTDILRFSRTFDAIVSNISKVILGKESVIRQVVTAFLAGGHILLEDNPGTGKTQLARGLANSIKASFKRIQFTPDLLPSDVVGVTFYDQEKSSFTYREGPIFANIVLADEINRASPKTQSALLEVMEEHKVTVDGVSHHVPQPFVVIATQNPIEQLGTYRLPEAQLDRFLIKTSLGDPDHASSLKILKQATVTDRAATIEPVIAAQDVEPLRTIASQVYVDDAILEYVTRIVEATRHDPDRVQVGSSMRGALSLIRCAKIFAAADKRNYVIPDDIVALARPVLAHRLVLASEASFAGTTAGEIIDGIVAAQPAPTVGVNR